MGLGIDGIELDRTMDRLQAAQDLCLVAQGQRGWVTTPFGRVVGCAASALKSLPSSSQEMPPLRSAS